MKKRVQLYHRDLIDAIKEASKESAPRTGNGYIGTNKPYYPVSMPITRQVAREWIARHPDLTPDEYDDLLDSLSRGETCNELALIGDLLLLLPHLRRTLDPARLDLWLDHAEGWGEVDSICQNKFKPGEILSRWVEWKRLLISFAKSPNVHKRRASLVLLTMNVRKSADPRLSTLAFANIERLEGEKHILITKAISWLLRDLTYLHRAEVEAYLAENEMSLPRVAVRETRVKLATGRKSKSKSGT